METTQKEEADLDNSQKTRVEENCFSKIIERIGSCVIAKVADQKGNVVYMTIVTPLPQPDWGCHVVNIYDVEDHRDVQIDTITDTDDFESVADDYAENNISALYAELAELNSARVEENASGLKIVVMELNRFEPHEDEGFKLAVFRCPICGDERIETVAEEVEDENGCEGINCLCVNT